MKYEDRIQSIAEEMAKDYRTQYWDKAVEDFPALISSLIPAARIAVKHMAQQYEYGHHDGWMSKAMNFNRLHSPSLKEGLIKSGLIPDDGQEAGSDEG